MKPEEKARQQIDTQLEAAGWTIQDMAEMNLGASLGIAIREFSLSTGAADYMLFVDRKAVGVIEAKPAGMTLSGVAEQSEKYLVGLPKNIPHDLDPIPFAYESTGVETYFRDMRDPEPCSRRIFSFHQPETLKEWLSQESTLRANLTKMPSLITDGLRECQVEAIINLEESLAAARPKALIQMTMGAGKTFTAVSSAYRLIKFANAKRILFLVDRSNLGRQTLREFKDYTTPDDGSKFTQIYNVQHLTSNILDPVCRVNITTIQRLYSMLKGEPEFNPENEEFSQYNNAPSNNKALDVVYNPQIPIETFDFIVTDECHRSIYHLWRQVLEYFDAFIIGLTATPSKQTLGFFNQNLVMEYNHERAVADGVNVGYEVYRIKTEITDKGSKIDAGFTVPKRDKLTRKQRFELLDEEYVYLPTQLDRDVVAKDQIRTVIKTFKEKLFTEIFPDRKEVPKTLIFAKDDSHAEEIVQIVKEEFGKGNDFCKKITYKTTGEKPEDLISSFRNSYNPRIAVTVDMISTGTDIKPLECLLFMRDVKSMVYFEQMKGRGTRTISETDFQAVTPGNNRKKQFIIVDAVGVCENDKTESKPLEQKRHIPFEKLITSIAMGNREDDMLSSLAGRLAAMQNELGDKDKSDIQKAAGGKALNELINNLLDAIDIDRQIEQAKTIYHTEEPTEEQIQAATDELKRECCAPFDEPELRNLIIDIKKRNEQVIDDISKDIVLLSGFDEQAKAKAQSIISNFKQFIEENKDEITALQIIYNQPYSQRHLTYEQVKQLAEAIEKPPVNLKPELLWGAYEKLEQSKVKKAGPQKLLTDIISLVRFALGKSTTLEPFSETVNERFNNWLSQQEQSGRKFTYEQLEWLTMIKEHITSSLSIGMDDLELSPFYEQGGPIKAYKLFDKDLDKLLAELNEVLAA